MEWLVDAPWKDNPAAILMALGTLIAVVGTRRQATGIMMPTGASAKAVTWMRGFRQTIAGLALLGIGAAWLWQAPWLLALSLVIGAGEIFESSLDVWALTRGRDLQLGPRLNKR